jgi:hypothetical protein
MPSGLSPGAPLAAEAPRLVIEEPKRDLLSKGGTMADWRGLITSGLQPEDPLWLSPRTAGPYDGARPWCNEKGQYHGIRVLQHTRPSPMLLCAFGAGLILEEASSRLIIWQHLINIISGTLPKSWRGTKVFTMFARPLGLRCLAEQTTGS